MASAPGARNRLPGRRGRPLAIACAVAAVLLAAAAIVEMHSAATGTRAAIGAHWQLRAQDPPAGSGWVSYPPMVVQSPVSAPGVAPAAVRWNRTTSALSMIWGPTHPEVVQTSGAAPLPPQEGTGGSNGVLIDDQPTVTVHPAATDTVAVVAGRRTTFSAATVLPTVQDVESYRWATFPISGGRFVHAWQADASVAQLTQFVGSLTETAMTLNPATGLGDGPPGLVPVSAGYSLGYVRGWTTYCPPGFRLPDQALLSALAGCLTPTVSSDDQLGLADGTGLEGPVTATTLAGAGITAYPNKGFTYSDRGHDTGVVLYAGHDLHLDADQQLRLCGSIQVNPDVMG